MEWMIKELSNVKSEMSQTYNDSGYKYKDLVKKLVKPNNEFILNSDTPRDFTEKNLVGKEEILKSIIKNFYIKKNTKMTVISNNNV